MIDRRVRQEWMKGKHDRQKGEEGMAEMGQDRSKGGSGVENKKEADYYVDLFCALLGTRTLDPLIKSQLLYQLS